MLRQLNQSACSVPKSSPESSGPLKKYYLRSRDFLRGIFFYPELYLDPGSCGGNTQSIGPKCSSLGMFLRWKRGFCKSSNMLALTVHFMHWNMNKECFVPTVF